MKYLTYIITTLYVLVYVLVCSTTLGAPAYAVDTISKGYPTSDLGLQIGMAVSLAADNVSVERASIANQDAYLGIVSTVDSSLLTLASKNASVYISNSGRGRLYVSDVNGTIQQGDSLVVSPLKGILMKASTDGAQKTSVATALTDFDGSTGQQQEISLDNGSTKQVHIQTIEGELGLKPVSIPLTSQNSLSSFGASLTGHPVSQVRILIAGALLLLIIVIEGSLIYAAISTSITAVGRNPLSKEPIYKQLRTTTLMASAILVFGVIGIYVVIWT